MSKLPISAGESFEGLRAFHWLALFAEAIEENLKEPKPTSMMCEQTASFALMTHLCSVLSNTSENIVPLSFWATREGAYLSRLCDDHRLIRLIGFFPRRPNLTTIGSSQLLVKINASLFSAIDRAAEVRVPLIIGAPLVSSILDYRLTTPCAWYRPRSIEDRERDHLIWLNQSGAIIRSVPTDLPLDGPLDDQALVDLAVLENPLRTWTGRGGNATHHSAWGG